MKFDVVIIGAGTAGLKAFQEARKTSARVALVSGGPEGTTCARVGCMPSKALIQVANEFHSRTHFADEGILGGEGLAVDSRKVLDYVRRHRDRFVAGVLVSTEKLGELKISGYARFIDRHTIEVGHRRIESEKFVIATGSSPIVPDEWRDLGDRLLTTDNLFELKELPKSMAVVGMGPIGLEMGQALSRLSVRVVGVGQAREIGGLSDPQVNRKAIDIFSEEFPLWLGVEARVSLRGGKAFVEAGSHSGEFDTVLAALGRRPNLAGLGLEKLGIALNEHGVPRFDRATMQIEGAPLFIAGDADADNAILHEAVDDGRIAGFNAARPVSRSFSRKVSLKIVFSDPNLAVVGEPFSSCSLRAHATGSVDFSDQGRAKLLSANRGFLRLCAEKETGRILGAEMAAPGGEHLAHLLAWAIQQRLSARALLELPFYHPTLEEGLRTALKQLR